jgi:uncharacterized repeat protein (TIGR03803 family)
MATKASLYGALLLSLAACTAGGVTSSLPNNAQSAARTTSSYAVAYSFRGAPDGDVPTSSLISDGSGRLYGVTYYGGATTRGCNGCGTFFTFDPASGQETALYSFGETRDDGQLPNSLLFYNGSFYGTTQDGGTSADLGTVFKIAPPAREGGKWNETILHRFHGSPSDGSSPSQLTIDASGAIYGTAGDGGGVTKCFLGCGAIFELTPPQGKGKWRETILHSFADVPDGAGPNSLILAPTGTLYGETDEGGRSRACGDGRGCGTVFALKPSRRGSRWTETIVHSFKAAKAPKNDGEFPSGIALTSDGAVYGVTAYGGPPQQCYTQGYPWSGCGTFFLLKPISGERTQWTESILYHFKGGSNDGAKPVSITPEGGGFYGTTVSGGTGYCNRGTGCGTLFHFSPPRHHAKWTETVAHSFSGGTSDGWDPGGAVVADRNHLYGVTMYGGAFCTFGCGTIYEFQP